ncbi:hypothetical protein COTS27_00382 [Spirochaetota bacterium]|nr:hypothetical protein COTS27_00382 [Spirochaetota bacterium]
MSKLLVTASRKKSKKKRGNDSLKTTLPRKSLIKPSLEKMPFKRKPFLNIASEMENVLVGQKAILTEIIISLLSGGHILINGLPGLAKTLIVKNLAKLFDLAYNRIQFTPDLMPADLIGYEIIDEKPKSGRTLKFIQGPIFAQIILADEINRSPAKTQAALLEAMEENNVTIMGKTYTLEQPFLVMATQNPLEQKGTYELPEAELDRFMSMINITYPSYEDEVLIAERLFKKENNHLSKVLTKKDYFRIQKDISNVKIAPEALTWIVRLVRSTRPQDAVAPEITKQYLEVGASVRATQNLSRAAQTAAYLEERSYIEKPDILRVMKMILRHRIRLNYEADADNLNADTLIEEIAKTI